MSSLGHNVVDFDLKFLRQRSWILVDALGAALGCGAKTGNGANVAQWWAERDLDAIRAYCRQDVRLAYRVFCRLTYREPKEFPPDVQSVLTGPVQADIHDLAEEDVRIA